MIVFFSLISTGDYKVPAALQSLPSELGNLQDWKYIVFHKCRFTKFIIQRNFIEYSHTSYELLYLENNNLHGTLSSEFGNLKSASLIWMSKCTYISFRWLWNYLWYLRLCCYHFVTKGDNKLSGSLSPELSRLVNLENLCLGECINLKMMTISIFFKILYRKINTYSNLSVFSHQEIILLEAHFHLILDHSVIWQ